MKNNCDGNVTFIGVCYDDKYLNSQICFPTILLKGENYILKHNEVGCFEPICFGKFSLVLMGFGTCISHVY